MAATASTISTPSQGLFPAEVSGLADDGRLAVEWHEQGRRRSYLATALAVPGWQPVAGERVLLAPGGEHGYFVMGPLRGRGSVRLRLAENLALDYAEQAAELTVRDQSGRLLFAFDASSRCLRLGEGDADVALDVRSFSLRASETLRLHGQRVHVSGDQGISLGVADDRGGATALTMLAGRLGLSTRHLGLQASSAVAEIADLRWVGRIARASIERVTLSAERLESHLGVVVQHAKDVFLRVQGLHQTTAERLRTLVGDSLQVKAGRIAHRALSAYKVRADKIHLG